MKHESVRAVVGRGLALGMGVCVAAMLFMGSAALAATKPAATESSVSQASLSIEPDESYGSAVLELGFRGISNKPGDPYLPQAGIATRAELAVYLARALQLPQSATLRFSDVAATDWACMSVQAVCDAGVMQGTSATTFSPGAPVSRQELMAAVIAALRLPGDRPDAVSLASLSSDLPPLAGFRDRNLIDPQYSASVGLAYKVGLFDPPAEGWLLPKLAVTHGELLVMLERAFAGPTQEVTATPASLVLVEAVDAYPKLSRGSKGSLVLLLQERLNAMTYYCGTPDGKYSSQTRDAVYAFQKYQRLKRTGVVDSTVWDALWSASSPVPVYAGDAGKRVEADLTRQVMMLIEDNKVVMTVHVSTGKYGTPTGDWHIRTLSHTWRPTSLGPVFAPCYFMARNAIHGYPSVPTHPASHNCIRTPLWIQLKIVDQLEMGELVHVFNNKVKTGASQTSG